MADAAIVGVVGAVAGALVAGGLQLRSTSSAAKREDRRALLADRKQVYLDFMLEWRRQRDHYWEPSLERPIYETPPDDVWQPLFDLVDPIRLLGDDGVADSASEAVTALTAWVGASDKVVIDRARSMNTSFETFLRKARASISG